MTYMQLLESKAGFIVADAAERLERARLPHYRRAGPDDIYEGMRTIYDLTLDCVRERTLTSIIQHVRRVAWRASAPATASPRCRPR